MKVLFLGLVVVLATATAAHAQQEDNDDDPPSGRLPRADLIRFDTVDFDADGFIAEDELDFFIEEEFTALNKKNRKLMRKIFLALDTDKDGKISESEFALPQQKGSTETPEDEYKVTIDMSEYNDNAPEFTKKALKGIKQDLKEKASMDLEAQFNSLSSAAVSADGDVSSVQVQRTLSSSGKKKRKKKFKRDTVKKAQKALLLLESEFCHRGGSVPQNPPKKEPKLCTTRSGLCWMSPGLPGCTYICDSPCESGSTLACPGHNYGTIGCQQKCIAPPGGPYCPTSDKELVEEYTLGFAKHLCRPKCNYNTPVECQLAISGKYYCAKDHSACANKNWKEVLFFVSMFKNLFPSQVIRSGIKKAVKERNKDALKDALKKYAKNVAKEKLKGLKQSIKAELKELLKNKIREEVDEEVDRLLRAAHEANELELLNEADDSQIQDGFEIDGGDDVDMVGEKLKELVKELDPFNLSELAELHKEADCQKVYDAIQDIGGGFDYSDEWDDEE